MLLLCFINVLRGEKSSSLLSASDYNERRVVAGYCGVLLSPLIGLFDMLSDLALSWRSLKLHIVMDTSVFSVGFLSRSFHPPAIFPIEPSLSDN